MKEYQLTPITETAVQAIQAKGQKGKIAKQIMLGIDAHLHSYQVCRKIDAGGLQPVQSFGLVALLLFACKRLQLAEKVYAVYEAGPLGYVLYRKLRELGIEALVCAPEFLQRLGSITKVGVPRIRVLLVEMAWRLVRFQPPYKPIQKWYQALTRLTPSRD